MKRAMRRYRLDEFTRNPFTMPVAHQEAATSGHSAGSVAGRGDTAALTPVEGCAGCAFFDEAPDVDGKDRQWREHFAERHP